MAIPFLPALMSAALPAIGSAVKAAVPGFVGSVVTAAGSRKERIAAENMTKKLRKEDRAWYELDRADERAYAASITNSDRDYAQKMRDDERAYAAYVLADDRAYLDTKNQADIAQYSADRDFMQSRSNDLAEKTAQSRGIDFTKMRDDAVAAGYNPMTALSMAHAYSKQVDYSLQGAPYSPQASYTATGGASGMGSAGSGGAVMSAPPAAGNFTASGHGYQSGGTAALARGEFIADALQRGMDTWSNKPTVVGDDKLANALRAAFEQDQIAEEVRNSQIPQARGFGYDLTKQEPFQPSETVGVPSLAASSYRIGDGRPPQSPMSRPDRAIPVRGPNGQEFSLEKTVADRLNIKPFDKIIAEDYEAIFGDVTGQMGAMYDAAIPYGSKSTLKSVPLAQKVKDRLRSGISGSGQIRNPFGAGPAQIRGYKSFGSSVPW